MITFEKLQLIKVMIRKLFACQITVISKNNRFQETETLDADPKATQQITFTENLGGANNRVIFFITGEAKESDLECSKASVRVLLMSSNNLPTACSAIYFASTQNQYKMTQCNTLNVKLSNTQLNKLKSGKKMVLN